MNSLVCIGVPTTSGGQGARGRAGTKGLSYNQRVFVGVPISSAGKFWSAHHLSCNNAPSLTPLTPARSQWPMNSLVCIEVPTTSGGQGARGQGGSELEQTGVSWSKTSELNVILGFRVPTTIGRKSSILTYSLYVSPPPGSKVPTQCPLT